MIQNYNASPTGSSITPPDRKKYTGVASIGILAVNPDNEKLRSLGWQIPEGAPEPSYVREWDRDGETVRSTLVRFLVQIQDLPEKPVVPIDFWIRPEVMKNRDGSKYKLIDKFGRTAWGTRSEVKGRMVPMYSSGPARIAKDYRGCHVGEEALVTFLSRFLNLKPVQSYSRTMGTWVDNPDPGSLTIDGWQALCSGDVSEVAGYIARQPDNHCKAVLGVRKTPDDRTFQTVLENGFFSNAAFPDPMTGEYGCARKAIDRYLERFAESDCSFSASTVHEWQETPAQGSTPETGTGQEYYSSERETDRLPDWFGFND